jgi:cytochrome c
MKKILILASVVAIAAACGSGGDKKAETTSGTNTEVKAEDKPANDLSSNPDYQKGLALVSDSKNLCLTCHKIDEKLTGPAYRDVANKYENTEANIKMLAEKVIKGGTGVWGEVPMPANSVVSPEDAQAIVKYILLLKNK